MQGQYVMVYQIVHEARLEGKSDTRPRDHETSKSLNP